MLPSATAFTLTLLALLLPACVSMTASMPSGRVAHTVYFWLKPGTDTATRDAMIVYYQREITKAPGVVAVIAGVPRASDRDVVDDSFTVGTTVVFESSAAEVAWQTEPIHDELKRLFFPVLDRVVVYDTLVTAPGAR